MINTFGMKMIYPGSTSVLQFLIGDSITTGRSKMVAAQAGVRNKLVAKDGNEIDSMLFDRRQ